MTQQSQKASVQKAEVAKLVRELNPAAKKCKLAFLAAEKSIQTVKDQILASKEKLTKLILMFDVTPGYAGKTLDIEDELLNRNEYIRKFWGVTPQHMLQVLDIVVKSKPTEKETDVKKTKAYKTGYNDRAEEEKRTPAAAKIKKGIEEGTIKKYEVEIGDFVKKLAVQSSHLKMLNDILAAIEAVSDRVPPDLLELAKAASEVLRTESTLASANAAVSEAEKAVDAAEQEAFPPPPTKPDKKATPTHCAPERRLAHAAAVNLEGATVAADLAVPASAKYETETPASFCTGSSLADLIREVPYEGDQP